MSGSGSAASDDRTGANPTGAHPPEDTSPEGPLRIYWHDGRLVAHAPDGSIVGRGSPDAGSSHPTTVGPEHAPDPVVVEPAPVTAPAGWYADPEDPWRALYWDGATWAPAAGTARPGSDRPAPPGLLLAGAVVFFTVLGIATGFTMWPASGASCHDHPPAAYPFGVTLSLWLLGVVLAVCLIVVTHVRRQQVAVPWFILMGTMFLPLFVALISAEDCLA